MENRSHALVAGLFTLALVAALAAWGWWFGGQGHDFRTPYVIVSRSAVSGLTEQAPVRYLGVEVGRVTAIQFDRTQAQTILVHVVLRGDAQVHAGTYAQLGYQGVTGITYVDLREDGSPGEPLRTSRARPAQLPMRPSLLQQVGESGEELMVSARDAAERLAQILNPENQQRMSGTLRNIDDATRQFAEMQRTITPALRGLPALSNQLERVLARTDVLVGNLNQLSVEARHQAEALESVARAAGEIGSVANDVHEVTLPRANRMIERLTRGSESLDELLRAQSNQPLGLLLGPAPPPPGPGEPGYGQPPNEGRR